LADTRTCAVGATSVGTALAAETFSTDADSAELPKAASSSLSAIGAVATTAGSTLIGEDTIATVVAVGSEVTELTFSLCVEASEELEAFSIVDTSVAEVCGATTASDIAVSEGACS